MLRARTAVWLVVGLIPTMAPFALQSQAEASGAAAVSAPTVQPAPAANAAAPPTSPVEEFQPFVRWGGRVTGVDISAFSDAAAGGNFDFLAATDTGGVLKSTDAGNTWQPLPN